MRLWWESGRVRWGSRGTTACTAAETSSQFSAISFGSKTDNPEPGANLDASIRGLAVGQHRQLDVEEAAVLAETETHALYWADVAYFPLGRFNGLIGNIGGRPLDVLSLGLHLFGIDFVDLLLFHIYKHVSLPQAHEQHAAFFTVVDIPGSRWKRYMLVDERARGLRS